MLLLASMFCSAQHVRQLHCTASCHPKAHQPGRKHGLIPVARKQQNGNTTGGSNDRRQSNNTNSPQAAYAEQSLLWDKDQHSTSKDTNT
jgi:hypothetical protein